MSLSTLFAELETKQLGLVSGQNIKTINNNSILGSGDLTIDKTSLNLNNIDNTSDLNKPISNLVQSALDLKEDVSRKNVANGYAGLDLSGKIHANQLSISGLQYLGTWNANTNNPTIVSSEGNSGDYYKVNMSGNTNVDNISDWNIGDWIIFDGHTWDKIDNSETVSSVAGKTGAVLLDKSDIGLANVDNTSDINKPIGNQTQVALDSKQNTLVSGTNIKTINNVSVLGSGNIVVNNEQVAFFRWTNSVSNSLGFSGVLPTLTQLSGSLNVPKNSYEYILETQSTYEIRFYTTLTFASWATSETCRMWIEAYLNNQWTDVSNNGAIWANGRHCGFMCVLTTSGSNTPIRISRTRTDLELWNDSNHLFIRRIN